MTSRNFLFDDANMISGSDELCSKESTFPTAPANAMSYTYYSDYPTPLSSTGHIEIKQKQSDYIGRSNWNLHRKLKYRVTHQLVPNLPLTSK